jgi:hypothetical protein
MGNGAKYVLPAPPATTTLDRTPKLTPPTRAQQKRDRKGDSGPKEAKSQLKAVRSPRFEPREPS